MYNLVSLSLSLVCLPCACMYGIQLVKLVYSSWWHFTLNFTNTQTNKQSDRNAWKTRERKRDPKHQNTQNKKGWKEEEKQKINNTRKHVANDVWSTHFQTQILSNWNCYERNNFGEKSYIEKCKCDCECRHAIHSMNPKHSVYDKYCRPYAKCSMHPIRTILDHNTTFIIIIITIDVDVKWNGDYCGWELFDYTNKSSTEFVVHLYLFTKHLLYTVQYAYIYVNWSQV